MTPEELAIVRSAFAKQICATAGVEANKDIERAFSRVRREDYLGSDPWKVFDLAHCPIQLAENDPVYAYQDALFVLSSGRGVNNGSPSLHARLLGALAPKAGETIVHLGAGTGYYTALLAELVGPDGHVVAVELDDTLAQIARPALESRANVTFHVDNAAAWPKGEVDGIYVNFAVLAPLENWIEGLAPDGRLVVPLGVPGKPNRPAGPRFSRHGAAFLIQRCTKGFSASRICQAFFIHAEGGAGTMKRQEEERLQDAFRRPGIEFVQSLIWQRPSDPTRCWFSCANWALSYDPVD